MAKSVEGGAVDYFKMPSRNSPVDTKEESMKKIN
jgi:hypothetical protein